MDSFSESNLRVILILKNNKIIVVLVVKIIVIIKWSSKHFNQMNKANLPDKSKMLIVVDG